MEALTEAQLVTELEALEKATLPADFHTQSKSKKAVSQFIHPLLMTCIAASAKKNPLQLPQRYLDEVTTWTIPKEASLPSGIGTGAAAGAGEPLAATIVDRSTSPASNPPEVTLAWEELGSSPFYRLSLLMEAWSQIGTTEKISAINEKLDFFIKDKEGDIKLKQQICDFVQSDEFSLFHLAKLLGCCHASSTLDQSQITPVIKHIARGGDLKALAFALVNSLSTELDRHSTLV